MASEAAGSMTPQRALFSEDDAAASDLTTLIEKWPMWNDDQRWPYQRFDDVARMLGEPHWDAVKARVYKLERLGKLHCVHSAGLNQVWIYEKTWEEAGG